MPLLELTPLYESERFTLIAIEYDYVEKVPRTSGDRTYLKTVRRHRTEFELMDKQTFKLTYLSGIAASLFKQQAQAWRKSTPEQQEVENVLEMYAQVCANPLCLH